jgi:GT2 family glycosyltransferase
MTRHEHILSELHFGVMTAPASTPGASATGVSVAVCTYRRPDSLALLLGSLRGQTSRPRELLVVDASPEAEARPTREHLRREQSVAEAVHYWQVAGPLRGLTRQRNFALRHIACDLVLFVDDDVILEPECVGEMEQTLRSAGGGIAGVGSYGADEFEPPPLLWRLRRMLRIVTTLQPGRYSRSGLSIPWCFERPNGTPVEGDWLPGCAMMWRTDVVQTIGFNETMDGYAQGEDLDFSLRARRMGRLVMLGRPRLEHRHAPAGRPNAFQLGYMELRNRFEIHRRGLPDRTRLDVAWFVYAWTLDTILLGGQLVARGRPARAARQVAGRLLAAWDLFLDRPAPVRHAR